jgi:hypothetical protein
MKKSQLQFFLFAQSLTLKVLFPNMELTRNVSEFRASYKRARKLPLNCSPIVVLKDLRIFMNENGWLLDFIKATKRYPSVISQLNQPNAIRKLFLN